MRWLARRPNGDVDKCWWPDGYTATDRSRALYVLGNALTLKRHPYERDPASGSGNCWCGGDQSGRMHYVVLEDAR